MKHSVVRVTGGVGNQLFQYAFGRALELAHGVGVRYDLSWFSAPAGSYVPRPFELDAFAVRAERADPWVSALAKQQGSIFRALGAGLFPSLVKDRSYREPRFSYTPIQTDERIPRYYDGYWQSEKYFGRYAETLRHELRSVRPPVGINAERARMIQGCDAVSLHVRRADYLSHQGASATYAVLGADYYAHALGMVLHERPSAHIFVFSDDPAWAQEHIRSSAPVHFINGNTGIEDLGLMRMCGSHIIANSSFSWWGAWLSGSPDGMVIAPVKWFKNPNMDTRDLIPDRWRRL